MEAVALKRNGKTGNIYFGNRLTEKIIRQHKRKYAELENGEIPVLAVNDFSKPMLLTAKTGILITDRNLYYRTFKDTFFASLNPEFFSGRIRLEDINSIETGLHDIAIGGAYQGHQLIVNGVNLGLLRLGEGVVYNKKNLEDISYIFSQMCRTPEEEKTGFLPETHCQRGAMQKLKKSSVIKYYLFICLGIFMGICTLTYLFSDTYGDGDESGYTETTATGKDYSFMLQDYPYETFKYEAFIPNKPENEVEEYPEIPSPDGRFAVKISVLDETYPSGESYSHNLAIVIRKNGKKQYQELVNDIHSGDAKYNFEGFNNLIWSEDSKHLFFTSRSYTTSDAMYVIDVKSGEIHCISAGDFLGILHEGKYKNCLVAVKSRYLDEGGRIFYASIMDFLGNEQARLDEVDNYDYDYLLEMIEEMTME